MTRETAPRRRGASAAATGGQPRRFAWVPAVEPLEGRRLLSHFFSGPTAVRPVQSTGGMYTLTMNGPGLERVTPAGHGQIALTLFGTTPASTLNFTLTKPRLHLAAAPLQIASIRVLSGQLGGIVAPTQAVLNGAITPISGVNTLQFAGLGTNAQIDVKGGIGTLSLGNATLGPAGHVNIGGDISQGLSAGALDLTGGRFVVANDITGPISLGAVNLTGGGQFLVAHDVTGGAKVTGDLLVSGKGLFSIGHNLSGSGLSVGRDLRLDSGGQLTIGNDLTGPLNVGGVLSISNSARLIVNLDSTGTIAVSGDLDIASGGKLVVNRTLNALTVNGNLSVAPSGGGITVGGDLTNLTVNGAFSGQGSAKNADLTVGLNLVSLNVLGGGSDQGGLQGVNINVSKSILGLNVPHGIFNSLITAGVNINGGGSSSNNIGADGTDAIHNSEIRSGVAITNLTIGGDVRSTFVKDPSSPGYRTRIVAGEDRQGNYSNNGLIDNFQITGALIDSVLAASVAPYGDSGKLPSSAYGAAPPAVNPKAGDLGFNTYDAPAGTITGGTFGNPVVYQNYSELSYRNEILTGVTYNTAIDPTIDDTILFGAINPSFATPPAATTAPNGTSSSDIFSVNSQSLSLPSKSTVLGGVISTPHGDEADFAGIFAADTRGVFVGPLP